MQMVKDKKVFIETSVFLRYLLADDNKKFEDATSFLKKVDEGIFIPYCSNVVIQEILYILHRHYKYPKKEVLEDLKKILTLRNLTLIEKTSTTKALKMYEKWNIKFGDCLIASQLPNGMTLVTYDSDFKKINGIKSATPADFDTF